MALERITGIVTDIVKHSDRHNVITLFTRERGRVAVLSPTGSGRTARMRNALLMPLSVITADINFRGNRDLQILGRFNRAALWKDLYFSPVKSSLTMFIAEFLNTYLRYPEAEPQTWDFIYRAVSILDAADGVPANFHLAFLVEFLRYAGIFPDLSGYMEGRWFDMREGEFLRFAPTHRDSLSPEEARNMPLLGRMNLRNARFFRFNAAQRRELLRQLIKFYAVHFPGLGNLRSPEILAEVFS